LENYTIEILNICSYFHFDAACWHHKHAR